MKNYLSSMLAVMLLAAGAAIAADLTFGQVVDGVDTRKNTKLASKEYWSTVRGREVAWSGELVDVSGSARKATLYVADKSRPLYKGYNIMVVTLDGAKAADIKKGQTVRFRGLLGKYKPTRDGAIIVVTEASLL